MTVYDTEEEKEFTMVEQCMLNPIEARVETACFQALKLKSDHPLSYFAFKFNLRRYTMGRTVDLDHLAMLDFPAVVGRCRLTLCNPS